MNRTRTKSIVRITSLLFMGTLISHGFGLALVPAMLPNIATDLDVGYAALGLAVAAGLGAYAVGALISARILDSVGVVASFVGSFGFSAIGFAVAGFASTPIVLAAATAAMGFSAPISWGATVNLASIAVPVGAQSTVLSAASSGAALGVLLNGILVRTSSSLHSWRASFFIAATLSAVPLLWALFTLRSEHAASVVVTSGGFRRVLSKRSGRVAVVAGLFAGTAGFPFSAFLTATALDEFKTTAVEAAALWWTIGLFGMAAGPVVGRYADLRTPLRALALSSVAYLGGIAVLVIRWDYVGLVAAVAGFAALNYPIWGLVGAIAGRHFDPSTARRAVSLGLVGASLGGAVANAGTGWWFEASGSFRLPAIGIAAAMAVLVGWYLVILRSGGLEIASDDITDRR